MRHQVSARGGARWGVSLVVALIVVTASPALLGPAPSATADGNEAPGGPLPPRAITAGDRFTCAILADGSVRCWGRNREGQLGLGDQVDRGTAPDQMSTLPAVDLGTGHTATAIAAGTKHVCALLDDATVKCWGRNLDGALGQVTGHTLGDDPGEMGDALPPINLPLPATAISAGGDTSCAILVDATLRCWGTNDLGQLGRGDNDSPTAAELHDAPAVDVGTGRTVSAVSAGFNHTCALLDDGTVKCWGSNFQGQLGRGGPTYSGTDPGDMGDALPTVELGTGRTVTAVSAGVGVTCALLDDATVKCWGSPAGGALGQGDGLNHGTTEASMGDNLLPIQLGTGRSAVSISVGDLYYDSNTPAHVCALLDNGTVKCWGFNQYGSLGLGDTVSRGSGAGQMGEALPSVDLGSGAEVMAVTTGALHSCALLADATVRCWGQNASGALGLGSTDNRGDAAGEMGAELPAVDLPLVGFRPQPTVNLVMSAVRPSTRTSEPIDYYVTVHNTGNATLTGVTLADLAVPDCAGPLPDLEIGVRHTVACAYTPGVGDVGTFSNTATVDTDQTDPVVSNQVDVAVSVRHQPDLAIKRAGTTFAGDGTYNSTGDGQGARAGRSRLGHADFVVRVGNDGDLPDALDLRRTSAADPGLDVRYVNATNGRDLTARIRAGTYHTRPLAPGESVAIRVEVDITSVAAREVDHPLTLRSRSGADPTRVDVVIATLRVH